MIENIVRVNVRWPRRALSLAVVVLAVDCGGRVKSDADEPTVTVEQKVTGDCTAAIEAFSPPGSQEDPSKNVVVVAAPANCIGLRPARYRFVARSPKTGTVQTLCDWQLGRNCAWTTASLVEYGLWEVRVETVRDPGSTLPAPGSVDGQSAWTSYGVGGVCRSVSVTVAASANVGDTVPLSASAICSPGVTPAYSLFARAPDGTSTQIGSEQASGSFSWPTAGLRDGRHVLEVRVRRAGNATYEATSSNEVKLGTFCDKPSATFAGSATVRTVTLTSECTAGATPVFAVQQLDPAGAKSAASGWTGSGSTFDWNVTGLDGTWGLSLDVHAAERPTQYAAHADVRKAVGRFCSAASLTAPATIDYPGTVSLSAGSAPADCDAEYAFEVRPVVAGAAFRRVCAYQRGVATCGFGTSTSSPGNYEGRVLVRRYYPGSTIPSESVSATVKFLVDADQDSDGYKISAGDCHDGDATIHPSTAPETCNGYDDNCNGTIDEGAGTTLYRDVDGDGFGDPLVSTIGCAGVSSGYSAIAGDCDDTSALVNPDALEICGNAIDENCDGSTMASKPAAARIEVPAGTFSSSATSISGDGTTATAITVSKAPFLWDTTGTAGLGYPVGSSATEGGVYGISSNGKIAAGGSGTSTSLKCQNVTFAGVAPRNDALLWNNRTPMALPKTTVDGVPVFGSTAVAVDPSGTMLAGFATMGSIFQPPQGFTWSSGTGMVRLTDSFGGAGCCAYGATSGVVVGECNGAPVRWSAGASKADTTSFSVGSAAFGAARGVSADGTTIVGFVTGESGSKPNFHAFARDAGGVHELAAAFAYPSAMAFAVDGTGATVVGQSGKPTASKSIATVWSGPSKAARSVKQTIQGYCVDATGWSFDTATGVSSNGKVIVGTGSDPTGRSTSYRIVLP